MFCLGEILQNPVMHIALMCGPADPDTHTPVILADMPVNIAQAIMPAMAAALFDTAFARGDINFIMKHGYLVGTQPEIAGCLGDHQA